MNKYRLHASATSKNYSE